MNISMEGDIKAAEDLETYLSDPQTTLPEAIPLEQIVERTRLLHVESGGSTYNIYFGNMAGLPLYAVSLYPERTKRHPGKDVPIEKLRLFAERNLDLLADPRNSVGLWYSSEKGVTFLDVSVTLPAATPHEQAQVISLAKEHNQMYVFDLADSREIPTGGSGKRIPGLPVEAERLPQLHRSVE